MYNCNILVIDDDESTLVLVKNILAEIISGDITTYSNSQAALELVNSDKMDDVSLIICDWIMPDVNGLDILAAFRKNHALCPFLILTGHATKDLVIAAMQLGATDFIVKPFHSNDLLAKVERVIHDSDLA